MNDVIPNPLLNNDGSLITSPNEWRKRRVEIEKLLFEVAYGSLPDLPSKMSYELLYQGKSKTVTPSTIKVLRVCIESEDVKSFIFTLTSPLQGLSQSPIIINGDGCWRYATDDVIEEIVKRGFSFGQFNRLELAPDYKETYETTTFAQKDIGALSVWAWGYHRCVDIVEQLGEIDSTKIAVVGHSRGGKSSLLAGATDERIALVGANNSGLGGAGSYYHLGDKSERLEDILKTFPFWFSKNLHAYSGKENKMPYDQHFLKALVAPRPLFTTEALGDLWSNPSGSWVIHQEAKKIYSFLNATEAIHIDYRQGAHYHGLGDWIRFLEFAKSHFDGDNSFEPQKPSPF